MIEIVDYKNLNKDFFEARSFADSNELVKSVLDEVKKRGDAALRLYGQKYDVSVPKSFEVPKEELKSAAEKLKISNREVYDAIVYSHELALSFAKRQRKSFSDFEEELEPGLFACQKTIPVQKAGCYVPAGRFPLVSTVIMTVTPAVAAGVKEVIMCTPPRVHPDDKTAADRKSTRLNSSH